MRFHNTPNFSEDSDGNFTLVRSAVLDFVESVPWLQDYGSVSAIN